MFHFIGQVWHIVIERPIFNLLIIILALIPGHNLGLAIIIFTVLIRLALYPLLKKQLHHAMAMRKLMPELKRIKKEAAGDRRKESEMVMALYKEREVSPFGSFGVVLLQLPILIALFTGINKIINDPNSLLNLSYSWLHNLPYMEQLAGNIHTLDTTLFGLVDLTRLPMGDGGIYWPAMVLVCLSVAVQYFQGKQMMMPEKNARGMRQILKDSAAGKQVDQSEVQAASGRMMLYFMPAMVFFISLSISPALSLYWFIGGLIAWWQQSRILKQDVTEMEALVDKVPVEAEIVTDTHKPKTKKKKPTPKRKHTKRRR
jgi:YidC/Oxa1 family membrane protein insertase